MLQATECCSPIPSAGYAARRGNLPSRPLHADGMNSYNIQGHSKYKQVMLEHKSPTILNPHVFNDILQTQQSLISSQYLKTIRFHWPPDIAHSLAHHDKVLVQVSIDMFDI